jgi:hypothetical protein
LAEFICPINTTMSARCSWPRNAPLGESTVWMLK